MNSLKLVIALVVHEVGHVLQRLVVDPADDLMEGVIDGAVAVGLAVPLGQTVLHVLAVTLHGHVDDRGHAAPRRRRRTGLEGVRRERATKGQLHVSVHVDAARDHVLAGGVDGAVGGDALSGGLPGRVQRGDGLAVDQNVVGDRPDGLMTVPPVMRVRAMGSS